MVDRLDESVQVIENMLEGGKVIVHGPGQRVSKQRIPKRVPVRNQDSTSSENITEYNEERRF